ncbi:hypothetical protein TTHERM_000180959 (macronuclear) [Tetrahymena thermophila SB210]|uniref:Uncharacterized protein n=1 Tax=Tetrahymena thermophila (strain SB210) TaxID=312017 RepID=W7XEN1_TETTS|nr:hypothetical protein TTHERM_000180959 [Tetrahymena thermophila SB210]EWS76212.1 hypothetical protein TTHERM_000180959 [Tetrahymena thermophila SB210]|eukprot:XP_012651259.1 hypothetical protein TTHERM_000180959 [Tetrahymena thermophila SB210]
MNIFNLISLKLFKNYDRFNFIFSLEVIGNVFQKIQQINIKEFIFYKFFLEQYAKDFFSLEMNQLNLIENAFFFCQVQSHLNKRQKIQQVIRSVILDQIDNSNKYQCRLVLDRIRYLK